MSRKETSRSEVNDLILKVRGMPDLVKFELFSILRDDLTGVLDPEGSDARLIRERREALEMSGKAIDELELGPREVPTQSNTTLWQRKRMALDGAKVQTGLGAMAARDPGLPRGPQDRNQGWSLAAQTGVRPKGEVDRETH